MILGAHDPAVQHIRAMNDRNRYPVWDAKTNQEVRALKPEHFTVAQAMRLACANEENAR